MPSVNRLIGELAAAGIGQRTAQSWPSTSSARPTRRRCRSPTRFARSEKVGQCEVCFNLAVEPTCRICQDGRREGSVICVVEQPSDVIPIERTGSSGRYHVLGGALSPIDGVDPEDLHITELLERVSATA